MRGNDGTRGLKRTSREYLKQALLDLMREKSAKKVTVAELCRRAGLNRSTFYDNFETIEQLQDELMWDVAKPLVAAVTRHGRDPLNLLRKGTAYDCYVEWFTYVHDNREAFRLLLGRNGMPEFHGILIGQGVDWYEGLIRASGRAEEAGIAPRVLATYIVGAHCQLLISYLDDDVHSPEYMARQVVRLTFDGYLTMLGIHAE